MGNDGRLMGCLAPLLRLRFAREVSRRERGAIQDSNYGWRAALGAVLLAGSFGDGSLRVRFGYWHNIDRVESVDDSASHRQS